ncbi:MAG: carbohydrate binding family 9 domain-containing protein [Acidobacteria bacterium]|nr:carbohydrate binding family 9 domain-containing protein [Acidobacteriota bacterium]
MKSIISSCQQGTICALLFILLALDIVSNIFADPRPSTASGALDFETARLERRLKAVRTTAKISIDGLLNEADWERAAVATDFVQSEPAEGQPASEQTEVRVLYDKDNLYFGVLAHDSDLEHVIVNDLKKDFDRNAGDSIEIVLDTFHDHRNGYQFATNPAGAKWDAQMTNEGREVNTDWDGVWYVKTRIVESSWIAEITVPFKTLKFRNIDVQTWGINFQRNLRRKNEDSYWAPIERIYALNRVSLAGTLEDLEGVKPGANVRLKPYLVSSLGQVGTGEKDYSGDFGFDAKYGLTSGLTWDFTYNTDFSQVEADEQQINLTRFNLFFPEKRDFFLENSGIFRFGGVEDRTTAPGAGGRQNASGNDMIFFFSRRVGLSDDGSVIPILAGTRLTGRTGAYEIGLLNIQQREQGLSNATNFTVGRFRRNIFGNSDVGVMLANREVQDSAHFNRVVGADANLRFGQNLNVSSYIAKAITPSSAARDLAGRVSVNYKDQFWDLRSSYTEIQDNFVDEMGFVPRRGIRKYAGYFGMTFRPKSVRRIIRQIFPHIQIDYILNRDENLDTRYLDTRYIDYHFPITFQNGSFIELGVNPTLERLVKRFRIQRDVFVPSGVYKFDEYFVMGRSDNSRRIFGNIRWAVGRFYTGYKHTYGLGGTFRLNHKFSTSFSYTQNNINLPQGHFKTDLLTTRVNYSFSTFMFLNALIQYNSDARQWSSNIRFNIIHRPLSDLFIVYNERRDSISGGLVDRALIGKFTYMISR